MNDEIKNLLKYAIDGLRTCGERDKRQIWVERLARNVPNIIAEIEFLEAENQKQQEKIAELSGGLNASQSYVQELKNKIKELEKLDEDNLLVITEMGMKHAKLYNENKQLKAACVVAERVVSNARKSKEYNNVLVHVDWIIKLQQALAAKEKK